MKKNLFKLFLFSLLTISILSINHLVVIAADSVASSTTQSSVANTISSSEDNTIAGSNESSSTNANDSSIKGVSNANNEAAIEITEDWEPKKPVEAKPAGVLPKTGEEKTVFTILIGLSIVLVICTRKLVQQRKTN